MKKHKLGNSAIEVAPFMLGGNVFGWTADERTSFKLLDLFVSSGFDFVDTADSYSTWAPGHKGGESETIIGNWLQRCGRRDRVVIFTKVGLLPNPDGQPLSIQIDSEMVNSTPDLAQGDLGLQDEWFTRRRLRQGNG